MRIVSLYTLFILLSCCIKTVGTSENKEFHQDISFSKTDSLTIDSLADFCYHTRSMINSFTPMQGTAFYLNYKHKLFLFSALHNFTGIDPETNKLIKGLTGKPKDLLVRQLFQDRSGTWIKYFNSAVRDSLAYSIILDTYRVYQKSPDAGKNYKLYSNNKTLFIEGTGKKVSGYSYDVGAYDISDSIPIPSCSMIHSYKRKN
jgi:hypothetical protein